MNVLIYTPMFILGSRVESLMHRLSVWSTNQNARLSCAALWLAEDAENWYSRKSQINLGASEFQNKTFSFDEIRIKLHKCFHATLGWNSPQAAGATASAPHHYPHRRHRPHRCPAAVYNYYTAWPRKDIIMQPKSSIKQTNICHFDSKKEFNHIVTFQAYYYW